MDNITEITSKFNKNYCILFSNGTTAIYSFLSTIDNRDNISVLLPAITCLSPALAVKFAGFKLDVCDIDLSSGNIDIKKLKTRLKNNNKIKIVIGIHLYGNPLKDINEIISVCKKKNIIFIEDAAQSIGTVFDGRRCGSFGDISILSFGNSKILDAGAGGALLFNDKNIYTKLEKIINSIPIVDNNSLSKLKKKYIQEYYEISHNNKYLDINEEKLFYFWKKYKNAFIYRSKEDFKSEILRLFDNENRIYQNHRKLSNFYKDNLEGFKNKIKIVSDTKYVPWRFTIRLLKKDSRIIAERLRNEGFFVSTWYPKISYFFKEVNNKYLPNADIFEREVMNFWVNGKYKEDKIIKLVSRIRKLIS